MVEIGLIDPRRRAINCLGDIDLLIPQFVYDHHFIGNAPEKEVTFFHLNDNINNSKLEEMCKICGEVTEVDILFHPKTMDHTGLAKVVFQSPSGARICVERFNNLVKIGNMSVKIDSSGKIRNRMYNDIINRPDTILSDIEAVKKSLNLHKNNSFLPSYDIVKSPFIEDHQDNYNREDENISEYSDSSNSHKYSNENSHVSSSLDPSRMVANSLTNEPLEPLDIRIQKLLSGTILCPDSTPKPVEGHNAISSSTEPFHDEEGINELQLHRSKKLKTFVDSYKRSSGERFPTEFERQTSKNFQKNKRSHQSKNTYSVNARYVIPESQPKKLTDENIERLLSKLRQQFIEDLKETLHRDICKRMIETTSYGSFHNWWDYKENEHRTCIQSEKLESFDSDIGKSLNKTSTHMLDTNSANSLEKSTVFKSQLSNFTRLPKIKRLACQKLPNDDTYLSKFRGKRFEKNASHYDSGGRLHRNPHHNFDNYQSHHYQRSSYKYKYENKDGFVSHTDNSDLELQNISKSLKEKSVVRDCHLSEQNEQKEKYENKLINDVRKDVNKILESSEVDTDKTEIMATNTNQENKFSSCNDKLKMNNKVKKSEEKSDREKNKSELKKPYEKIKDKITIKAPTEIFPLKTVNKFIKCDIKKPKIDLSSSGTESDFRKNDIVESDFDGVSRSSTISIAVSKSKILAGSKKSNTNREFDTDCSTTNQFKVKKPRKRFNEELYGDSCVKNKLRKVIQSAKPKMIETQENILNYELEMYFNDIAFWRQVKALQMEQAMSHSYKILTNQHKQFDNKARFIVDTRSKEFKKENNDSTDSAEDEMQNTIRVCYHWDDIILHDHNYFQIPSMSSRSACIPNKVTKVYFKSSHMQVEPCVDDERCPLPKSEAKIVSEIFSNGVDAEDIIYLKSAFKEIIKTESLQDNDSNKDKQLLFTTLQWSDISHAIIPPPPGLKYIISKQFERVEIIDRPFPRKRLFGGMNEKVVLSKEKGRNHSEMDHYIVNEIDPTEAITVHSSGSARTQGFYTLTNNERRLSAHGTMLIGCSNIRVPLVPASAARYLLERFSMNESNKNNIGQHFNADFFNDYQIKASQKFHKNESQKDQMPQQINDEVEHLKDLFSFKYPNARKKLVTFAKSGIHRWGLVALEPIAPGEVVAEYAGQLVRRLVAEHRERRYEQAGISSSYLFRLDDNWVVDATTAGSSARFVNHSCQPNCAVTVTDGVRKKIVISARRPIAVLDEITYDYRFPTDEDKIVCLCGTAACRGTLN